MLDAQQLKETIENRNGIVNDAFYKKLTARTYSIDSDGLVIEFYDGQGILLPNSVDFKSLREVKFTKNKIGYLHPRVSYYFRIDNKEADRIIKELDGKHLEKYKPQYEEYFNFKVFQLINGQTIIQYDEESYLYEDLDALAFSDNDEVRNIHYPDGYESGRDEFLKGNLPEKFNVNQYLVYPKEAKQLIKTHELSVIQEDVKYKSKFKSILYQAPKGYFILMEDFDQLNAGGRGKIEIGDAHIFKTKDEFDKAYQKSLERQRKYESNPELRRGVHIYKKLSDKYGADFPNHTFEELNQLPSILNFDSARLDFSVECAEILSEAVEWNFGGEEFFNQIIHPILAYIGEYHKSEGNGDWSMRLDRDGKVWEPRFTNSDGEEVFDIIDIYKDFYEAEYGIPSVEFYVR